jgi:hypothetical protein
MSSSIVVVFILVATSCGGSQRSTRETPRCETQAASECLSRAKRSDRDAIGALQHYRTYAANAVAACRWVRDPASPPSRAVEGLTKTDVEVACRFVREARLGDPDIPEGILEPDWAEASAIMEALCHSHTNRMGIYERAGCLILADYERVVRVGVARPQRAVDFYANTCQSHLSQIQCLDREFARKPGWLTPAMRVIAARGLLAGAPTDLDVVAKIEALLAGNDAPEAVALRQQAAEGGQAGAAGQIEGLLVEIDTAVQAKKLDSELLAKAKSAGVATQRLNDDTRLRFATLIDRASSIATAKNWHAYADALLAASGLDERRAPLRAEAARFHEGLARTHTAEKRFAAARFHAARARAFGARLDLTRFDAELTRSVTPSLRVVLEGACPWLVAPTCDTGGPVIDVAIRIGVCKLDERSYTERVSKTTTKKEMQEVAEGGSESVITQQCVSGTTGCVNITSSRTVGRTVTKKPVMVTSTETADVPMNELVLAVRGKASFTYGARSEVLDVDFSPPRFTTSYDPTFHERDERKARERVKATAQTGLEVACRSTGRIAISVRLSMAGAYSTSARARLRREPLAAEDDLAMGIKLTPYPTDDEALLARSYGLDRKDVRTALGLRN